MTAQQRVFAKRTEQRGGNSARKEITRMNKIKYNIALRAVTRRAKSNSNMVLLSKLFPFKDVGNGKDGN